MPVSAPLSPSFLLQVPGRMRWPREEAACTGCAGQRG
jgi:hypothetical protein